MWSLYKGSGLHALRKNFRGIRLSDTLFKAVKKAKRRKLAEIAEDVLSQLQFGGMPHRGTDLASHIVRLASCQGALWSGHFR